MAEKKEQLRIEGELDTSKLKSGAKQGFDAISKEEKKVQQESRQTSKALDDIGNAGKNAGRAMQQAGQQSTSALKNIGNEAKNTVTQIDNIAKATKQIKLQQALGAANRAITELAPVGQMLGKAAGMSDDDISLAGAGISGAMSGAMIGASIGGPLAPLTAAGGALVGAASALMSAGRELQKAAEESLGNARERISDRKEREEFSGRVSSGNIDQLEKMLAEERANLKGVDKDIWGAEFMANGARDPETMKKYAEELQKAEDKREKTLAKIAAIEAELAKKKAEALRIEKTLADISAKEEETRKANERAEQEAQSAFNKTLSQQDTDEARAKERYGLEAQVNTFIKGNKFDDAFKLINEHESKYRSQLEIADKAARNSSLTASQRQDALSTRNKFKGELDFVGTLSDRISDAQGKFEENTAKKGRDKEIKSIEDFLGYTDKVGENSLTDALTRVGGGGGYGVQMNGIATKVTKISSTLQEILAELKKDNGESSVGTFVEG